MNKKLIYGKDLGSGKIGFVNLPDVKITGEKGKEYRQYYAFYPFEGKRTGYTMSFHRLTVPRIIPINPLLFKSYFFCIENLYKDERHWKYSPLITMEFYPKGSRSWRDMLTRYRFNEEMLKKSLIKMPFKDGVYPINLGDALKLLQKGFRFLETTKDDYECLSVLEWL